MKEYPQEDFMSSLSLPSHIGDFFPYNKDSASERNLVGR